MQRSEIRKDYIQEKYVIIAPRRAARTSEFPVEQHTTPPSVCHFCPKALKRQEIIQLLPAKSWRFAVIKNKFPSVSPDNPKAYGIQEVIVETSHHTEQLDELSAPRIAELLKLYADRTTIIKKNKKIQYILIFKNNGGRAGASILHSHSQLFATAFIPPNLKDKSEKMLAYRLNHGTCAYCDVIKKEAAGPRFVTEQDTIVAFTPYASMHNYEIWILPKRHIDNITQLTPKERLEWARILKKILGAIGTLGLPYNYYFHEAVFDENQHLYMKITPRGSVWAGVEIGSGLIVNPIAPEDAAKYYRTAFKQ